MAAFECKLHIGMGGLAAIELEWTSLFLANRNQAFYNDWRWHAAIARHLIQDDLFFLEMTDSGRTIAILPLQRRRTSRSHKFVTLPRHPHIVLGDMLVHPAYLNAPLLAAAVRYVLGHETLAGRYLLLSRHSEHSNLAELCRSNRIPARVTGKSCVARFAAGGEKTRLARQQLRSTVRHENQARALHGVVEAVFVSEPTQIMEAFETLMRIEASGWKGSNGTGTAIALHPPLVNFYRDLLSAFAQTGQASLGLLRFGGRYVAGDLSLIADGTAYSLKVGYDEAYARFGPGSIMLMKHLGQLERASMNYNMTTAPDWGEAWHFEHESTHEAALYRWRGATLGAYHLRRSVSLARARIRGICAPFRG